MLKLPALPVRANRIDDEKHKSYPQNDETSRFPAFLLEAATSDLPKLILGKQHDQNHHLLYYQISGRSTLTLHGTRRSVLENDIIFTGLAAPLRIDSEYKRNNRYLYFIIGGQASKLCYNLIRGESCIFKGNPHSGILGSLNELFECGNGGTNYECMRISALIQSIFTQLYEIKLEIAQSKAKIPLREMEVRKAVAFIHKRYGDAKLSLDVICREVCLSKNYFCTIFHRQVGMSISRYLNQYRINKSKELLAHTKLSVDAIARTVGFANPLSFLRNFKKELLMTPGEYRKYY